MEDLFRKIQESYGINVYGSRLVGCREELDTCHGPYYLYRCPSSHQSKSKFVAEVQEHLSRQGDIRCLPNAKTVQDEPFLMLGDEMVYLKRGVRLATPANEAYATGEALARFHLATASLSGDKGLRPYSSFKSWPDLWTQKIKRYDTYRDLMDETESDILPIDEYLLTMYTYVRQWADIAVQYLTDSGYHRMQKEAAKWGKVAYQNFEEGYLLFDETGERYVTGEWNWVLDMRARDLAQWIKSDVRRNGWNEEKVHAFLEGYLDVTLVTKEEFACMYALLMYPGRFLRLIDSYRETSEEDLRKGRLDDWAETLDVEFAHMETALQQFPELISNRFGAVIPTLDWLHRRT